MLEVGREQPGEPGGRQVDLLEHDRLASATVFRAAALGDDAGPVGAIAVAWRAG